MDLIHTTAKLNLIQPGDNFKSLSGQPCVRAHIKAEAGWLFMLKQSIIFVVKPVIYSKFDEMKEIEFSRTGPTSKQFDIKIVLKSNKTI